jgi:uncharacterized protein YjbI with pentapeptide repeats
VQANLREAKLREATLERLDLSKAYLRGTNLDSESQVREIKLCKTVMSSGQIITRDFEK